ncbi:hypothetical protein [Saccharopolyspora gloriosae]|uniref:hypothetical protein n=1 Tax=Saccharopolyspora gloriosae TaxID=455344 RepID=UPI001FB77470|nr:hypothetical protein [Saccharopolyspora gloriosae]
MPDQHQDLVSALEEATSLIRSAQCKSSPSVQDLVTTSSKSTALLFALQDHVRTLTDQIAETQKRIDDTEEGDFAVARDEWGSFGERLGLAIPKSMAFGSALVRLQGGAQFRHEGEQ